MIEGLSLSERIEFTSSKDTDPKTVFVLKPLSGLDRIDLSSNMRAGERVLNSASARLVLELSIVEVRNWKEEKQVKEIIEVLPAEIITELLDRIVNLNQLGKDA